MEKQKHFFSRENRTSLLIALILTILNIAIVFCFDLQKLSFESRGLTAFQIIGVGRRLYIVYRLLYFYADSALYDACKSAVLLSAGGSGCLYPVFFLFSVSYRLGRSLLHALQYVDSAVSADYGCTRTPFRNPGKVSERFVLSGAHPDHGKTVIAIRKDIAYEKQYREDHMHEKTEE